MGLIAKFYIGEVEPGYVPIYNYYTPQIDTALFVYEGAMIRGLAHQAYKSHLKGSKLAYARLDIPLAFDLVNEDAMLYAGEYSEMMISEGATMIQGEKVKWVAEQTKTSRTKISKLIDDGIRLGKPTGIIAGKMGGYSKGTLAHDLEKYFHARKSHASTVARTETARIQNQGLLTGYERNDLKKVTVSDGGTPTSCDTCNAIDGQTWTIEYARNHELEHPNCTRDFLAA